MINFLDQFELLINSFKSFIKQNANNSLFSRFANASICCLFLVLCHCNMKAFGLRKGFGQSNLFELFKKFYSLTIYSPVIVYQAIDKLINSNL